MAHLGLVHNTACYTDTSLSLPRKYLFQAQYLQKRARDHRRTLEKSSAVTPPLEMQADGDTSYATIDVLGYVVKLLCYSQVEKTKYLTRKSPIIR